MKGHTDPRRLKWGAWSSCRSKAKAVYCTVKPLGEKSELSTTEGAVPPALRSRMDARRHQKQGRAAIIIELLPFSPEQRETLDLFPCSPDGFPWIRLSLLVFDSPTPAHLRSNHEVEPRA
jgi:hypothetical protein